MNRTEVSPEIGKNAISYVLNVALSKENQERVTELQRKLKSLNDDAIWLSPAESLHITLMDWIAPLVDYDEDKDELFKGVFEQYDKCLSEILNKVQPFEVTFESIIAKPKAIFIKGADRGEFNLIRSSFLDKITLMPNTKLPPKIIHFTVGRFTKEVNLEPIERITNNLGLELTQEVSAIRLVREAKVPMLNYEVIKEYKLN